MKGDITLDKLAETWNVFLKEYLPMHNDDLADFRKLIHDAQRIILARQARELRITEPESYIADSLLSTFKSSQWL